MIRVIPLFVTLVACGRERVSVPEGALVTTVVEGAQVVRSAPQTTPDALRFQPGVSIQQTTPGERDGGGLSPPFPGTSP